MHTHFFDRRSPLTPASGGIFNLYPSLRGGERELFLPLPSGERTKGEGEVKIKYEKIKDV